MHAARASSRRRRGCSRRAARRGLWGGGAGRRGGARAEAGVSPGLLRHYFDGIDALIAETYAWTGAQVSQALAEAVAAAGAEPRAQLLAYVTASFRRPIADPQLLATWIAFWSLVKANP